MTNAETLIKEGLAVCQRERPDDWRTFELQAELGGMRLAQKNYADAEPLLTGGYDGLKHREVRIPAHDRRCLKETAQRVMELYKATSRPDKAADWEKRLQE
jgi:hypothetical protein